MIDIHNHTKYSFDSKAEPLKMVEKAFNNGADIYGFAEHVNLSSKSNIEKINNDLSSYIQEIDSIKNKFPNKILLHGVEFNYVKNYEETLVDFANKYNLDYIINSVHTVNGDDLYTGFFENKDIDYAYNLYFDEMLKSFDAKYPYQIVGHFGFLLKSARNMSCEEYFERYYKRICEVLKEVIKHNVCLEANTKTYGITYPIVPHKEIFALYRELGGEKISFGADAHEEGSILYGIRDAISLLKNIGFKYAYYYVGGKENKYPLENIK